MLRPQEELGGKGGPLVLSSKLLKFWNISVASLVVGAGLGAIAAWFMSIRLERQYQMAITEGGVVVGGGLGLLLGWIGYYGIFKQQISYQTFCTVTSVTAIATAASAYVLHRFTDTGGWLSIFVAAGVFLASSYRLRRSGVHQ